jgi:hypothetical protein
MSSPWLESKTPVGPPTEANPTLRQLLFAALVTGAWSGLLCLLVYVVARLVGVTFVIEAPRGSVPEAIAWFVVLVVPLASAVLFALGASLLRGWRHAGRIAFWIGTLVALASLAVPLSQPGSVGWGGRLVLALMHLITWFLVVPQIARIIGDSEPGQSVDRDA